eukprot:2942205-Rhodomonas_salina.2
MKSEAVPPLRKLKSVTVITSPFTSPRLTLSRKCIRTNPPEIGGRESVVSNTIDPSSNGASWRSSNGQADVSTPPLGLKDIATADRVASNP